MKLTRFMSSMLLAATCTAAPVLADDLPQPEEAPIITLYRHRVELAKLEAEKARSVAQFEQAKYQRVLYLYQRQAAALEEVETQRSKYEVASLDIAGKDAEIKEQEALLLVSIERSNAGLVMPICPVDTRD